MQPRTLMAALAVALLALVAVQSSSAYYRPSPVEVRTENRNLLVQWSSAPVYNPAALNTVTYGKVGHIYTVTVPQSLAIEMHLDFLDRYEIRLEDFGSEATPTQRHSTPPNATLRGEYAFQETGFVSKGATCPTVRPISPQDYFDATGQPWPVAGPSGQNATAGVLQTTVSKHSVKDFQKPPSYLWRYENTQSPDPLTHPKPRDANDEPTADDEWSYGGSKNAGWDLTGVGYIDYYCRTDAAGKLYHNSWVEPLVYETGNPTGGQA